MEYYVNLNDLELSVSKKTIFKWFKDCAKVVRGYHLVEVDDFADFVCTYRGGKYMAELCGVTLEEVDKMDYETVVPILMQRFFDHIVMVSITGSGDDELDELMRGRIFNVKFMTV